MLEVKRRFSPYEVSYNIAVEELKGKGPSFIRKRAEELGIPLSEGKLIIPFFGRDVVFNPEDISFESASGLTLASRIIIMHYLAGSGLREPTGEWINYRSVPGGLSYYDVFRRRALKPILRFFKGASDFVKAGVASGWKPYEFGDASLWIMALPKVPLVFVFWEGDEEFESTLDVLFDKTITEFFNSEDVVKLSKLAALRLLASGKKHVSAG